MVCRGILSFYRRTTLSRVKSVCVSALYLRFLLNANERINAVVFRREPLWKVSMNVRVRPTVRCTFDEEDDVLRVAAMEAVEDASDELVIYAFKVCIPLLMFYIGPGADSDSGDCSVEESRRRTLENFAIRSSRILVSKLHLRPISLYHSDP